MASATRVCNTYRENWFVGYEGGHRAHRSLQNHIVASSYSSVHADSSCIAHGVSCQRVRRMVRSSSFQLLNNTYSSELQPHSYTHIPPSMSNSYRELKSNEISIYFSNNNFLKDQSYTLSNVVQLVGESYHKPKVHGFHSW